LTLRGGHGSSPASTTRLHRGTPVVLSAVTPRRFLATRVQRWPSVSRDLRKVCKITLYSSGSSSLAAGTIPTPSNSTPLCTSRVASPPSSRIIYAPTAGSWAAPGHKKICSAAHQYCSKVSFFQANTGTPAGFSAVPLPTTTAAAASSWVEKILHDAHRTSAPNAVKVSI